MVATALLLAAASFAAAPLEALPAGTIKRELTPADAVATLRVMESQLPGSQRTADNTSPDGRRYLLRLAHGDVNRNGVWVDLLTGSLDSLESASHPRLCAHLFTTGLGSAQSARAADADPSPTNQISWLNNFQIAFLWSDPHSVRQVMSVDLLTCKHHWLTHSATNVYSFAATPDGALLFNAQVPEVTGRSAQLWVQGFTLNESADGWSILEGRVDGTSYLATWLNTWFIQSGPTLRSVNIDAKSVDISNPNFREVSTGPSGRYAIIGVGAASIPLDWNRYSNTELQKTLKLSQTDRVLTSVRFAVIDLHGANSRMLWNAPNNSHGRAQWSPRTDHILLAPTFLPPDAANPLGLIGAAAADVEVSTGNYRVLPLDLTGRTVMSSRWLTCNTVEILSANELAADFRTDRFVLSENQWHTIPATGPNTSQAPASPIHLETRQSLNRPPQIFAVDSSSGAERLILDTNPHLLKRFKLGRVERISGTLANGRQWLGQLIYPADYAPGNQYPLVIQSIYARAFGPEEFSLTGGWGMNGMGLGPSDMAAYPGQLLATRNIAVLELEVLHPSPGVQEAEDYQLAFETLAEQLSASGLVDRNKIGLDGFSRNGFWVEFALTHSRFPFAAAIAADNYDPSYFQSALSNWRELDVAPNGATAFGTGLQEWLKHAPGFNAEHIHTPLRMIGQSDGVPLIMAKWEIYSRLRRLKKPVELYMMPEANTYPSHIPQNPRQITAIQDGVIDWFSFWLTGREDFSPQKREQYVRWHAFAASQTAATSQSGSSAVADPQL
jgi:hypothetical protein